MAALCVVAILLFLIVMLVLPNFSRSRTVARRYATQNRLKSIGLALHNYHDTYDMLPPAYVVNAEGEPLYSWRVLLLPFLEEKELYEQFDLEKPWWSDHNRALLDKMPTVYASPFSSGSTEEEGKTPYRAVVDTHEQRTVLRPTEGRPFKDVSDGLSNSVMAIGDPSRLVEWTKPEDIAPLDLLALTPIGENEMHGILILNGDGRVRFIGEQNRSELVGLIYCEDERVGEQ
ncbi:DUF1559 family PulG-like putative transporter [Bremerella alba]|nr:DUF1559 domain-containing protein [Bremerella alba]